MMTRKETLQIIRCLLIENGNVINREVAMFAHYHGISLSTVKRLVR